MTADVRERVVLAAMTLFARKGYGATSVAEILHEGGVHAGSLYHVFPGKQDVLLAVLEAYRQGIRPMLLEPAWKGVADPVERVFALLARYRELLAASECTYGCPIGSIALELHEPDPVVRELLVANFDAWVSAVEECLVEAGSRLPADVDRRSLAKLTLATMEGGVMLSRTERTLEGFDAAVSMLRMFLNQLEAPAASSPSSRLHPNR